MLDLLKFEAGKMQLFMDDVNLHELVYGAGDVDMVIEKGVYSLDTLLRRLRGLIGSSQPETAEV